MAKENLQGINKESPPNSDRNPAENIVEKTDAESNAKQTRRAERYAKVWELREKHYSISAIARTLKMHRRTVRLFLCSDEMPVRQSGFRRSSLTRFVPFLEKRWAEGCRNATKLRSEIQAKGFQGSGRAVRHFLQNWREPIPEESKRGFCQCHRH